MTLGETILAASKQGAEIRISYESTRVVIKVQRHIGAELKGLSNSFDIDGMLVSGLSADDWLRLRLVDMLYHIRVNP